MAPDPEIFILANTQSISSLMGYVVLLIVLILINAFFAASELAVVSLNANKIKRMAEEGNKKAKILASLTEIQTSFLATIQIGVTLSGFMASAVAADTFVEYFVTYFSFAGISPDVLKGVGLFLITLLLSFFTLIFGELVPKRLAMKNPEKISFMAAVPLKVIYTVFKPLVKLLSVSTDGVAALLGVRKDDEGPSVSEEEIRIMMDAGSEEGTIKLAQKEMIDHIFEFDDVPVNKILTHRTSVAAIEQNEPLDNLIALSLREGFSRIPVYQEDIDDIIGVVYVKDLLVMLTGEKTTEHTITEFLRPITYVFESAKCNTVFRELKEKKMQLAVVLDEYGGTEGIVTLEDLVESIVGEVDDEYDDMDEKREALKNSEG